MPLSGKIELLIQATLVKALDLDNAQDPLNLKRVWTFADGVGDDQCDLSFHDIRPLTTGQAEEIDVVGVLEDAFGDTLSYVEIAFIFIKNLSTNDDNLLVGKAASNALQLIVGADGVVPVKAGGWMAWCAPDDGQGITVSTNDKLKIEHDGTTSNSLTYEIVILGRSA